MYVKVYLSIYSVIRKFFSKFNGVMIMDSKVCQYPVTVDAISVADLLDIGRVSWLLLSISFSLCINNQNTLVTLMVVKSVPSKLGVSPITITPSLPNEQSCSNLGTGTKDYN